MIEDLLEIEFTDEQLIEMYGAAADDIPAAPSSHDIEEAIEGTLEEDKGAIEDEISE